ncbi:MAG TPA: low affinity iron permease family protein, partial [Myxococcaceae bacterium]|nr:low affinity iron permease family protein [Myxococcaceae bacterium]
AIHLKLDELIRAQRSARNIFADLEDATTEEIELLQEEFKKLRAKGVARREAVQRARPSAEGRSKR